VRCDDNIEHVEQIVLSRENQSDTQMEIARELGISQPTAQRILKENLFCGWE